MARYILPDFSFSKFPLMLKEELFWPVTAITDSMNVPKNIFFIL
jgi:hypothetical protein